MTPRLLEKQCRIMNFHNKRYDSTLVYKDQKVDSCLSLLTSTHSFALGRVAIQIASFGLVVSGLHLRALDRTCHVPHEAPAPAAVACHALSFCSHRVCRARRVCICHHLQRSTHQHKHHDQYRTTNTTNGCKLHNFFFPELYDCKGNEIQKQENSLGLFK